MRRLGVAVAVPVLLGLSAGIRSYTGWPDAHMVLLAAIICGVVVVVGYDITDRLESRHAEREREWWALVTMLTDERNERIEESEIRKAADAQQMTEYRSTTYPFKLKPEDSVDATRKP